MQCLEREGYPGWESLTGHFYPTSFNPKAAIITVIVIMQTMHVFGGQRGEREKRGEGRRREGEGRGRREKREKREGKEEGGRREGGERGRREMRG